MSKKRQGDFPPSSEPKSDKTIEERVKEIFANDPFKKNVPANPASPKKQIVITLPEMTRPRVAAILCGVGVLCIIVGIYISTRPDEPPNKEATSPQPSLSSITPSATKTIRLEIPANIEWYNTGLDVTDKYVWIEYQSGRWSNTNDRQNIWSKGEVGQDWPNLLVPDAGLRTLVAKVGGHKFRVGTHYDGKPGNGILYLSMNDLSGTFDDNVGALVLMITLE